MSDSYRALTQVLLGAAPPVEAGEVIPESYLDLTGAEQPIDFERLVELGSAEKIEAPKREAPKRKTPAKD